MSINKLSLSFVGIVLCLALFASSGLAATVVTLGTVSTFSGPGDLDLDGNIVYAINFDDGNNDHTVNGVTFVHDVPNPPGTTFVGPQTVSPWQTKPEFGATVDDDALEEIIHDIRWANSGNGEIIEANLDVTPGTVYKLQVLFNENSSLTDRRWDIRVEGADAVDEVTSLGLSGTPYSIGTFSVFTYEFTAQDDVFTVTMGDLFGANDGGDRNPIWSALTLENQIPEPSTIMLAAVGLIALLGFGRRRRRSH